MADIPERPSRAFFCGPMTVSLAAFRLLHRAMRIHLRALLLLSSSVAAIIAQTPAALHQWVNVTTDPLLLNLMPGGGSTDSGYTEYVCRARSQGALQPGRYAPAVGRNCFVGSQGAELALTEFEVLADFSGYWVPASTVRTGIRPIPDRSLEAGVTSDARPAYACRAFHRGLMHIGQFTGSGCQIGLNGEGVTVADYEMLVNPWVFRSVTNATDFNAPQRLYACRAETNGTIMPGVYALDSTSGTPGCWVTPPGGAADRVVTDRWEVLTNAMTGIWVSTTGLIPGALRAGRAIRGAVDMNFVCRARFGNSISIGRTAGGPCQLITNATVPIYEVLVPSPNLSFGTYRIHTKATNRFWARGDASNNAITTLTQPNTDAARFNFLPKNNGTYRLVVADTNRELLHDENLDGLVRATGNATDDYASFYVEQIADQGSYRLRTLGGRQAYVGEIMGGLISGRSQTDNDSLRVLLEPSFRTELEFGSITPGFGEVPFGVEQSKLLSITNNSGQPVSFTVNITGRGYTQSNNCPATLANRLNCLVTVTFSPAADGAAPGTLTIAQPGGVSSQFPFQATGVPPASLSSNSLLFATLPAGQRSPGQVVTLTNLAPSAFNLVQESTGPFGAFSSCGGMLAARGTCSVVINYQPVGTTGTGPQPNQGTYTFTLRNAANTYTATATVRLTGSYLPGPGTLGPAPQVVNSASFAINQPLAPNSIATLFGSGLSTETIANSANVPPTTLGGVTLTVRDDRGTSAPAQLFFVSPGQVNFLIPPLNPAATLAVITDAAGRTYNARIAPVAPGIYQASPSNVPAAFYDRYSATGAVIELNRPVVSAGPPLQAALIPRNAGERIFLLLYGTGIRARSDNAITATIGGVSVPVQFAGDQRQFPGLDQVNLGPLPPNVPSGLQEVRLSFNGLSTNVVTIRLQ